MIESQTETELRSNVSLPRGFADLGHLLLLHESDLPSLKLPGQPASSDSQGIELNSADPRAESHTDMDQGTLRMNMFKMATASPPLARQVKLKGGDSRNGYHINSL